MGREYRAKVFRSGNSVALRLPKALGLKEGMEMKVREEGGSYVVEPVPAASWKIDLTGIYGSIPDLRPLAPDERLMEPRDLDRPVRLLKRG